MAYKGKYKPINPHKYKGNPTNIIYRSLWERRFMVYCDTNDNIKKWSSEEITVPYRSPIDRKLHRYYPDFYIEVEKNNGLIEKILVEVKPKKQTKPPTNTKNSKRYLEEVKTWSVNKSKWEAAILYCEKRKWTFKILTEDQLLSNK